MNAALIENIQNYFKGQPVLKAWLFGSYARGEETPESDADIMVVFDHEHAKIGLFKYAAMVMDLERILQMKVDLVEEGSLLPFAEKSAEKDKILVYERADA